MDTVNVRMTMTMATVVVVVVVVVVVQLLVSVTAMPGATTRRASLDEMTFDPMTSSPNLKFTARGWLDDDAMEPDYTAIASTPDGSHLILVDDNNRRVKVMVTSSGVPNVTSYVTLAKDLWDIALLPDGMIALTTLQDHYVYLLHLQGDVISFTKRFYTSKRYDGIAAGLDNDTLLVTSRGGLDVITRDGEVVESFDVPEFVTPDYMCSAGGDDVIVSDWSRRELIRVNARTGQVVETLSHPDIHDPHQVAMDRGGNVYVASRTANKLMVVPPAREWRTLIEGALPTAVTVTANDVIVSWDDVIRNLYGAWIVRSTIKGYSMSDVM